LFSERGAEYPQPKTVNALVQRELLGRAGKSRSLLHRAGTIARQQIGCFGPEAGTVLRDHPGLASARQGDLVALLMLWRPDHTRAAMARPSRAVSVIPDGLPTEVRGEVGVAGRHDMVWRLPVAKAR